MTVSSLSKIAADCAASPELAPLAQHLREAASEAVRQHDVVFPRPHSTTLATLPPPPVAACAQDFNLAEILTRGARTSEERDLFATLTLLGWAGHWPTEPSELVRLARELTWLEANSGLFCLSAALTVLDIEHQRALAAGLVDLLASESESRASRELARAWLLSHPDPQVAELAKNLQEEEPKSGGNDSWQTGNGRPSALTGELGPTPRGALMTALLALTLLLFVARSVRAVGRLTLGYRHPVSLWLSDQGLEIHERRELLGRVLGERRRLVPLGALRSVVREVRYARAGLYAGFVALTLGSFVGVRLFVDGLRVPGTSAPLLGLGLLLVMLGLGIDYALTSLSDTLRRRCRLVVTPRRGRALGVQGIDPGRADEMLHQLALRLGTPPAQ